MFLYNQSSHAPPTEPGTTSCRRPSSFPWPPFWMGEGSLLLPATWDYWGWDCLQHFRGSPELMASSMGTDQDSVWLRSSLGAPAHPLRLAYLNLLHPQLSIRECGLGWEAQWRLFMLHRGRTCSYSACDLYNNPACGEGGRKRGEILSQIYR